MGTLAEQKKIILPYLQRADEIASLNPKVAYYCRVYAIQQGIAITDRQPEIEGVLEALMEKLEQDKPKLNITKEDAQECEAFAVTVFNRADRQDRAGKAGPTTVKAFYVATIFIEILSQFGELPDDMAERQRYAAWKAADIRKALRDGRVPQAGPPASEDGLDLPDVPGAKPAGGDSIDTANSGPTIFPAKSGPSHLNDSSQPTSPQRGVLPQDSSPGEAGQKPRFRPGSKVFYNPFDGPPVKGTVVSIQPSQYGSLCQVGLRQKVVEVPQDRLAYDFEIGDPIMYAQGPSPPVKGKVERIDSSRWPIAYLVSLEDGQTLPTTENTLSPVETLGSSTTPGGTLPQESHTNLPSSPEQPFTPSHQAHDPKLSEGQPDIDQLGQPPSQPGQTNVQQDEADPHYVSSDHGINYSSGELHLSRSPEDEHADEEDNLLGPAEPSRFEPDGHDAGPTYEEGEREDVAGAGLHPETNGVGPSDGAAPSDNLYPQPQHYNDQLPPPGLTLPGQYLSGQGSSNTLPGQYPDLGRPSGGFDFGGTQQSPNAPGLQHTLNPDGLPGPGLTPPPQQHQLANSHPAPGFNARATAFAPSTSSGEPDLPMGANAMPGQNQRPAAPYQPSLQAITEAQKFSKYAASSLGFEDIPTALKYLQQAMDLLQGPSHR